MCSCSASVYNLQGSPFSVGKESRKQCRAGRARQALPSAFLGAAFSFEQSAGRAVRGWLRVRVRGGGGLRRRGLAGRGRLAVGLGQR
jgi:hypothetical protein